MWDWNGRQKIDPLGTLNPLDYRWSDNEVDLRINFHTKQNPGSFLEDDSLLKCLRNAAVIAGTPGFLVSSAQIGNYEKSDSCNGTEAHYTLMNYGRMVQKPSLGLMSKRCIV